MKIGQAVIANGSLWKVVCVITKKSDHYIFVREAGGSGGCGNHYISNWNPLRIIQI